MVGHESCLFDCEAQIAFDIFNPGKVYNVIRAHHDNGQFQMLSWVTGKSAKVREVPAGHALIYDVGLEICSTGRRCCPRLSALTCRRAVA